MKKMRHVRRDREWELSATHPPTGTLVPCFALLAGRGCDPVQHMELLELEGMQAKRSAGSGFPMRGWPFQGGTGALSVLDDETDEWDGLMA